MERNNNYVADNGLSRPKYHSLHNMQLNTLLTGIVTLWRKFYALIEEACCQEAHPEQYPTLGLAKMPLEKAIRESGEGGNIFTRRTSCQLFPMAEGDLTMQ